MNSAVTTTLRVTGGGRIVIPSAIRDRLGLKVGSKLMLRVEADHATLMNAQAARRRACQQVRRYVQSSVSLSKELLAERKIEAQRD